MRGALSEQQFEYLVAMIEAKLAVPRNSAGPHVRPLKDEAEHCEHVARMVLVDGLVFD